MTATTTARVEVLTAEVRVLMVGSRQITLSVYAQLDQVKPGEIDPFGRVRPRDAEHGWTYVVGASARDADRGTLVRSTDESAAELRRGAQHLRRLAALTRERDAAAQAWKQASDQYFRRINGKEDRPAGWDEGEALRRIQDAETRRRRLDSDPGLVQERAHRAPRDADELESGAAWLDERAGDAAQWDALPLIVLAGLR